MKQLWAPWRMEYLKEPKAKGCVFCSLISDLESLSPQIQRERLILSFDANVAVLMNKYPYTNGHLLVLPRKHTHDLNALGESEFSALHHKLRDTATYLKSALNAEGLNIGLNLGKAAGAGVEEHLHYHIVPRWIGDNNYMAVIAETRVISDHILATYDQLLLKFQH